MTCCLRTDANKFKAEFEKCQKEYGGSGKNESASEERTEKDEEGDKLADDLGKLKVEGGESETSTEPAKEDGQKSSEDTKTAGLSPETREVGDAVKADT